MSKTNKKRFTEEVEHAEDWTTEVNGSGLLVADIYYEGFGACTALDSTIAQLMKSLGERGSKIRWRRVNMQRLEQELVSQRLQAAGNNDAVDNTKAVTKADQLECLGQFSQYENPKPLFAFMLNKKVYDVLHGANPIQLEAKVRALLDNEAINSKNEASEEFTIEFHAGEDDTHDADADPELEKAAVKIQSVFRGHKVRKDIQDATTGIRPEALCGGLMVGDRVSVRYAADDSWHSGIVTAVHNNHTLDCLWNDGGRAYNKPLTDVKAE